MRVDVICPVCKRTILCDAESHDWVIKVPKHGPTPEMNCEERFYERLTDEPIKRGQVIRPSNSLRNAKGTK